MMSTPSIYLTLRETTREQWFESFAWLLYSLAGSTVPIWLGGYVLLPIFGTRFSWVEYGKHGEFALYSAALLAPTLRLIAKDIDNFVFVRRQGFLFFGWIFLTGSVAIYSSVIAADRIAQGTANLNTALMVVMSLVLYAASLIFSFVVIIIDSQRLPTNLRDIVKAQATKLEADFDKASDQTASTENNQDRDRSDQQSEERR
jgi:hypothetical protein